MGGFEGGDEGGFWDEDAVAQLIHKQNTPSKQKKSSPSKPKLIKFVATDCKHFTVGTSAHEDLCQNIHKAYKVLLEYTCDDDIEIFFENHKVVLIQDLKKSDAYLFIESFLYETKKACNLILRDDEIASIIKTCQSI